MLDLVPLAGSRRIVADRDRHASLVAQFLEVQLPGPRPVAITASAVGADEQPLRPPVVLPAIQPPPPPDALDGELRRVMRHPDVDHRPISRDVVSAVGNGLAFP